MQSVEYLSKWAREIDGDQFLEQYDLMSLSDDDLADMWIRYDKDDSGAIDPEELRLMLEDVMELTQGHRHISDQLFNMIFKDMDLDGNGTIEWEEFMTYIRKYGMTIQHSSSPRTP